jgi:hypothetical protein
MRVMFLTLVCGGFLALLLGCGGGSNKVELPKNPTPPPQNPQFTTPAAPGAATGASTPRKSPPPPPPRR